VGGGSCDEAETQIVRFGNHRGFSPVRMSNRIQEKHLYKSRKLRDAQRILYKISSELYPEKTILDIISRVIGVVWCVRSEDAEFS